MKVVPCAAILSFDTSTGSITETGIAGSEDSATQVTTIIDPTVRPKLFRRLRIERVPKIGG